MNIGRPDLNLLVVFEAVASTGSVTRAASLLSLSQPAVSHALNRLRAITGDPLFVRSRGRLAPTPQAERMAAQAAALIADARAIMEPSSFDVANNQRTFRIACSDYSLLTIMPSLVKAMRAQSAGTRLEIAPVGKPTLSDLESGMLDASFWGSAAPGTPFQSLYLHNDKFVCATCARHPLPRNGQGESTLADYLDRAHARVSIDGAPPSSVDRSLDLLGHKRHVAVTATGFSAVLTFIQGTDLVATIPARLTAEAERHGLVISPLPFDVEPISYSLIWHRRKGSDPAHIWFRDLVAAAAEA